MSADNVIISYPAIFSLNKKCNSLIQRKFPCAIGLLKMCISQKQNRSQDDSLDIILRQMDLWYRTPLGSLLLKIEQRELDHYLPKYVGRHLVQVGGPSEVCLFEKSSIVYRSRLTPEYSSVFLGPTIQGNLHYLPLLPESIDVILLPHVLEFISYPQNLLEQLYKALVPGGNLIIFGFNPWSFWGFKRYINQCKTLPWRGHFRRASQVIYWLKKIDYVIEAKNYLFFRPPWSSERMLKKGLLLEAMGSLFCSNNGGIYSIIAKKNAPSLIPNMELMVKKSGIYKKYLEPT